MGRTRLRIFEIATHLQLNSGYAKTGTTAQTSAFQEKSFLLVTGQMW
jgi:hypothetical protein